MKYKYLRCLIALPLIAAACDVENMPECPEDSQAYGMIRIGHVGQNGFHTGTSTRSTYTEEYATVFEDGDKLGLILIDEAGSQSDNIPFSYNAGVWNNDEEREYQSGLSRIVAYFPYDEDLPENITTVDGLKETVSIALDQSDPAVFSQSDLLICEIGNPTAELNIDFEHAFSLISLSAMSSVTVDEETFEFNIDLHDVSISIGENTYTPCLMNGTHACLIKDGTDLQKDDFRYSYIRSGEDRATKTVAESIMMQPGSNYAFPCPGADATGMTLSAGDLYCISSASGNTVVIPSGASELPEGLSCQGIVFHVMDGEEFSGFCSTNGLEADNYPGYEGMHGLLVSPQAGGHFTSGTTAELLPEVYSILSPVTGRDNTEISNGYILTKAITDAATTFDFTALDGHTDGSPQNATEWYLASFNELKYLIRGGDGTVVSTAGQEHINTQLAKVGGVQIAGNIPSVTFKDSGFCIMENGNEMGWHGIPDGESFRPVCAF